MTHMTPRALSTVLPPRAHLSHMRVHTSDKQGAVMCVMRFPAALVAGSQGSP